ncbi:MAG TPA: M20/M25/M40 family metallo-hydrolase [Vicinamibacterales bacterium]|nr:M20/M25/M40 family metallo-hydrolase [Vicinamibacterales bacterium]
MKTRVAMLAVALAVSCRQAIAQPAPAADRPLAREILKELVEIQSTEEHGTARVARAIAERLLAAGFPQEDVHVIGHDARTQNVVARYHARNPRTRGIMMMAHIDVVPARREDWSVDPWTLLERDGWLYGRGSSDNKAGAAMLVANVITLKRAGWQPDRDLVIVLTGDEETAQKGIQWLLAEHRSLVEAELAFNTDGGGVALRDGKPAIFEVQASEKIYADYQLEVTDIGGHSSLVRPGNPIYTLAAALTRIGEHQFPLHTDPVTRMFLDRSSSTETGQTAIDMRAVAAMPPDLAAAGRLSRSPFYNAQLRTTCVATKVEAGHAPNALPQMARAVVNCRILPGLPGADVEAVIRKLAGDKVKVTVLEPPIASPPSVLTPALLSRLEPLVRKHWPGLPAIPTMETGATDGMYTRSNGIPTYGISALDKDPDDVRAHGKDERVGVESFYKATQFWLDLMRRYGEDAR